MITDRTISLLQSLLETRSPSKQLELLQEYCLYEADMAQQSHQVGTLLSSYKRAIAEKQSQGAKAAAKRKKVIKIHECPKFFPQFRGIGNCAYCQSLIDGTSTPVTAFFHRFGKGNDEVRIYCPLPSCFPSQHKDKMLEDRDYIKTMLKSK